MISLSQNVPISDVLSQQRERFLSSKLFFGSDEFYRVKIVTFILGLILSCRISDTLLA